MTILRVHDFIAASRSNGPGLRAVLWLQGCTLGCEGCFNPLTHPTSGGSELLVPEIIDLIESASDRIEGLTISGGEPLQQFPALLELVRHVRATSPLSIIAFTGFTWHEFIRMPQAPLLQANLDVLISGRYVEALRSAHGLIGSSNKSLHFFTDRYAAEDFQDIPEAEVIVDADGNLHLSGIDPLKWY